MLWTCRLNLQLADINMSLSQFEPAQACVEAGILAATEARLLEQQVGSAVWLV